MTPIQEIKKLEEYYEVKVIFEEIDDLGGYILYDNPKFIFIGNDYKKKRADLLKVFFHELGHIHCLRTGKWKAYHSSFRSYDDKKNYYKKYLRTALKAERWVDNWAYNELKKYDKRVSYDFPYSGKEAQQWFYKSHLNSIKLKLKNTVS